MMKTVSVSIMNLCVPCENRCRYCLLSYDGKVNGIDYKRSERYAKNFYEWLRRNRSEISFTFGFGYSMEHPNLLGAIDFCNSIGSVTGGFLQFDGMKFRTDEELEMLMHQLKKHGVNLIDLTFYGTESYHDRFAARKGDYRLMMRTLEQANKAGLEITVSIPLTHENAHQMDVLLEELERYRTQRIVCFIPHSEGRGRLLDPIRFCSDDYNSLSEKVKKRLNTNRFRTESQWLRDGFSENKNRALSLVLTEDNIEFFEYQSFEETIAYLEKLDEDYYRVIPSLEKLAKHYGNPEGNCYYSARDLYLKYQRQYISEHQIEIYDINDERQCSSRRF